MAKEKHWWSGRVPSDKILVSDDYNCLEERYLRELGLVRIQDLSITDWDDYLEACLANIIDYPFDLMKERIGDAVLKYCPNEENFRNCYEASKHVAEQGKFLDPSNVILKILNESYGVDEQWNLTYGFGLLKNYEVALKDLFSANRKNFNDRVELFLHESSMKRGSARNMTKRFINDLPKNYDANRDYELKYQLKEDKILIEEARLKMIDREIEFKTQELFAAESNKDSAEEAYDAEDQYWTTPCNSPNLAKYEQYTYQCQALRGEIDALHKERKEVAAYYNELLAGSDRAQEKKSNWDGDPVSR